MALRKMRISYYTFLANTDKKSFTCLPTFWVLEVLEVYPVFLNPRLSVGLRVCYYMANDCLTEG